jgi:phospholipid N-methyltransferase
VGLVNSARFLFSFLRHPTATGAIAPSSRWLARRMVEDIGLEEAGAVAELGPGTGAFTQAILTKLKPGAVFVAIELNAEFARILKAQFPEVAIINDSAERLGDFLAERGKAHADAVVSSLPWAGFPRELQEKLMKAIAGALRPGGRFVTFAYLHASWLPAARRFRGLLESIFPTVTTSRTVWRNLPPAFVYRCTK